MAIPESIKKLANDIRTKIYGRDVRESLAKGIEEAGSIADEANTRSKSTETKQTSLEKKYDEQIANMSLENPSVAEVVDARVSGYDGQSYTTIGKRFDSVDAQLAQTEMKMVSVENANATKRLNIVNYLGNIQNVHPKVLYFENGWNGYKYWMAYTPYPETQAIYENPCISVSNDLYTWKNPDGLTNPIYPQPPGFSYNSDTHLVYRPDLDQMELWWREVLEYHEGFHRKINRMVSTDGVTWSTKETIFDLQTETAEMLSPAIIFEDNKYKIWYVYDGKINYRESLDSTATSWGSPVILNINYGNLKAWHVDVEKTDLGYEIIFCTQYGINEELALYHCVQNGELITNPQVILKPSKDPTGIDNKQIYRSCLLKIDGVYHIFYSHKSNKNEWGIALLIGRNIFNLRELKQNKILEYTHQTISPSENLSNYNVEGLDVVRLDLVKPNSDIIINSISGGYLGKKITMYVWGASSKAIIKSGNGIILPNYLREFVLSYQGNTYIDLVCSHENGAEWRAIVPKPINTNYTIAGGRTLTNYDVSDTDTLRLNLTKANADITINSFVGGYLGKRLTLYVWGSESKAIVNGGNGIVLPNFTTSYELSYQGNASLDLICSDENGAEWRALIQKPANSHQTISPSSILTNYSLYGIDTLRLNLTKANADITINSFTGGHLGKRITIYVWGAASKATLNSGNGIVLPNFAKSYELSYQTKTYVDLVCSSDDGKEWRVLA